MFFLMSACMMKDTMSFYVVDSSNVSILVLYLNVSCLDVIALTEHCKTDSWH